MRVIRRTVFSPETKMVSANGKITLYIPLNNDCPMVQINGGFLVFSTFAQYYELAINENMYDDFDFVRLSYLAIDEETDDLSNYIFEDMDAYEITKYTYKQGDVYHIRVHKHAPI